MIGLTLDDLATRQAGWLEARLNAISQNIANSDTPGYLAKDVKPFTESLENNAFQMTATSPLHIGRAQTSSFAIRLRDVPTADAALSGNTVSVDQEFVRANEVRNAYGLNTSIVRAFNRMIMNSLKG
ncbi:MAG: flagellar basal body rod protein FlgB [Hyphomicrobiales bacterium]|nr:flagellar basal body rod protein FlgB [Hyphomicrobiales bacterium]